jgi:hypothetical protein
VDAVHVTPPAAPCPERCPAPEVAALAARSAEFTGRLHQDTGDPPEALRLTGRSVDLADVPGDDALMTDNPMRGSDALTSAAGPSRWSSRRRSTRPAAALPAVEGVRSAPSRRTVQMLREIAIGLRPAAGARTSAS